MGAPPMMPPEGVSGGDRAGARGSAAGSPAGDHSGLFAVYGHPEAVHIAYQGLFALQHRGQQRAGMAAWGPGDDRFALLGGRGLVTDVFSGEELADLALGPRGTRSIVLGLIQQAAEPVDRHPLVVRCRDSHLAVAINGGLAGVQGLRQRLEAQGAVFRSGDAAEIMAHLAARAPGDGWPEAIGHSLTQVDGGMAAIYATPQGILGFRDRHGIRPLLLGRLDDAYLLVSESCAFDAVGADTLQEVPAGHWLWIDENGLQWGQLPSPEDTPQAFCIFELIYLARADSRFSGRSAYAIRQALGRQLAAEHTVDADVVLGVPDASLPAAMGYSAATGIPFELGLVKNRYVGRTFIGPRGRYVPAGVRWRLNPIRDVVAGRRVVLVDDSIVRGSTIRPLVSAVRQAGAAAVHLCITSPPFRHPCPFGVDLGRRGELLAAGRDVEEMRRLVGADSLYFLSLKGMLAVTGQDENAYCHGCFTGRFPPVGLGAEQAAAAGDGNQEGDRDPHD